MWVARRGGGSHRQPVVEPRGKGRGGAAEDDDSEAHRPYV